MVSKIEQGRDRKGKLSDYLYGVSKLFVSGVGIGGLSLLITGQEMGISNYVCVIMGSLAAFGFIRKLVRDGLIASNGSFHSSLLYFI